jgi:2-succinyl-6-hydroxy-2,4-cyclohexadiene-1-carboxylate synthase
MDKWDNSSEPYWEEHPGNGPYLLLLHGILSSRAQWIPNIEALSKVARPVVVELLGHGRSPAPESPEAYLPEGYVEAFEKMRKRLGAEKWLLCGQSLGAGITLRYALAYPERVIAQVFTNTNSGLSDLLNTDEAKRRAFESAKRLIEMGREGIEKIPVHPIHARHLREDIKAALLEDCAALSVLGVANTMRYTTPEVSVRHEVHRNTVPTLLVCGSREKRFKPSRDFAEANMPLLTIADLEGGHAVNIDAAEEFNRIASAFISEHIPPARLD